MDTKEKQTWYFQKECEQYLAEQSLADLRNYGIFLHLPRPTVLKKKDLIHEISAVVCGNQNPKRTNRGAPIKNRDLNTEIPAKIEEIKAGIFSKEQVEKESDSHDCQVYDIQKNTVSLQISVCIENLTEQQKKLLKDFLNSL